MSKKIGFKVQTALDLAALAALGSGGYYLWNKMREMNDPAYRLGNIATKAAKREREDLSKMPWPESQSRPRDFIGQMGKLV